MRLPGGERGAMWDIESLSEYYRYIFITQGPTPICAKLSLGVALYLIQAGNRKPGQKLLTSVIAAHMAIAAFMSMGQSATLGVMLVSLGVAIAAGISIKQDFEWRILPEDPGPRMAAMAGYLAAFVFPLWFQSSHFSQILMSPMGSLPHQTLCVVLVLGAVGGADRPKLLTGAALAGVLILAAMDFFTGNRLVAVGMLVFAGVGALPAIAGGGLKNAFVKGSDVLATNSPVAKTKQPAGKPSSGRKWDLK